MCVKATPGTEWDCAEVHDTRKGNVHYLQMCSVPHAFFLFWNIKQREARGLQLCYYKHCCLTPPKLEYFSIYFDTHMTTV
jgi:hypothetical protein